jgi:hypothetical protein
LCSSRSGPGRACAASTDAILQLTVMIADWCKCMQQSENVRCCAFYVSHCQLCAVACLTDCCCVTCIICAGAGLPTPSRWYPRTPSAWSAMRH